jgi:thiamine-monophosphate kinase
MSGSEAHGAAPATSLDEQGLIERYFRPLATAPGAFSLLDDAASYTPPPGADLVLTKDGIAEDIHFLPGEDAGVIARKALRVNLSDLAAKGATPVGYLVLLGLSDDWSEDWVARFAEGLAGDQNLYGATLYGGDTIRSGRFIVTITAFGTVASGGIVRRAGARAGDHVYVSGTIGDGALGLLAARGDPRLAGLGEKHRAHLLSRYHLPQPRVALAESVARFATAALDVSDGLVGDLDKLCTVSGVTARVSAADVPLSEAAGAAVKRDPALLSVCLTGGDDYEIICTVPPEKASDFEASVSSAAVPVRKIAEVTQNGGRAEFVDSAGLEMDFGNRSFSHIDSHAASHDRGTYSGR